MENTLSGNQTPTEALDCFLQHTLILYYECLMLFIVLLVMNLKLNLKTSAQLQIGK